MHAFGGFARQGASEKRGADWRQMTLRRMGKPTEGWMLASPDSVPTTQPRNTCSDEELDMFSPKTKTKNSMVFSNKYTTQLFPKLELGLKIPMFFLICMNKIHFHGHHTQGKWNLTQPNHPIHKICLNDSLPLRSLSCVIQPREMALNMAARENHLRSFVRCPNSTDSITFSSLPRFLKPGTTEAGKTFQFSLNFL